MKGKAGGLAVGAVVAAIAYLTSGLNNSDTKSIPPTTTSPPVVTANPNPAPPPGNSAAQPQPYETVEVFYATDRAVVGSSPTVRRQVFGAVAIVMGLGVLVLTGWLEWRGRRGGALVAIIAGTAATAVVLFLGPGLAPRYRGIHAPVVGTSPYGAERGELQLGKCEVTIPHGHDEGELEQPSILRLELNATPERHVMLQRVIPQQNAEFYEAVRQRVQASSQRDLFVFVHGYNVTFEAAARRTAQISHDLKFAGAPIFFSWPSQGKTLQYTVDENNVAWAVPHLKQFLSDLVHQSDARAINLIAHSMGSRALAQAVRELSYEFKADQKLFQQVILAAPDIDADVFRDQIVPALTEHSAKVTLYASSHDEALAASKVVHGARRAGETEPEPLVVPGVETIDVDLADLGLLGHSYYSNPLVLRDLDALLRESLPAASRPWLTAVGDQPTRYWKFQEGESSTASRSATGDTLR